MWSVRNGTERAGVRTVESLYRLRHTGGAEKKEEEELAQENGCKQAVLEIKEKVRKERGLKGMNLEEGATAVKRTTARSEVTGHEYMGRSIGI